jgi:hypothetical protein
MHARGSHGRDVMDLVQQHTENVEVKGYRRGGR